MDASPIVKVFVNFAQNPSGSSAWKSLGKPYMPISEWSIGLGRITWNRLRCQQRLVIEQQFRESLNKKLKGSGQSGRLDFEQDGQLVIHTARKTKLTYPSTVASARQPIRLKRAILMKTSRIAKEQFLVVQAHRSSSSIVACKCILRRARSTTRTANC
jgi:hypothetical protein